MATLEYEITGRLIEITLEGDYTVDAFLDLVRAALDDQAAPARALLLIDARESTVQRSPEEIKEEVRAFAALAPRLERAAVVTARDLHYGLTRMASALAEDSGLVASPFRDMGEARAFLGLPPVDSTP